VSIWAYKAEIAQKKRLSRGEAGEMDNFFINVFSGFTDLIDGIILNMKFGGWMMWFSLLVGGFGIANIMFVSVKERTNLIGFKIIRSKKNKFILFQFYLKRLFCLYWWCNRIVFGLGYSIDIDQRIGLRICSRDGKYSLGTVLAGLIGFQVYCLPLRLQN
jgi:putative ABC transport system permease protein